MKFLVVVVVAFAALVGVNTYRKHQAKRIEAQRVAAERDSVRRADSAVQADAEQMERISESRRVAAESIAAYSARRRAIVPTPAQPRERQVRTRAPAPTNRPPN